MLVEERMCGARGGWEAGRARVFVPRLEKRVIRADSKTKTGYHPYTWNVYTPPPPPLVNSGTDLV